MTLRGKAVKVEAVKWLRAHPEAYSWTDLKLANELKRLGIYSNKTNTCDMRLSRLRLTAALPQPTHGKKRVQ